MEKYQLQSNSTQKPFVTDFNLGEKCISHLLIYIIFICFYKNQQKLNI